MTEKTWCRGLGVLALCFTASIGARGGDINPPAGPVAPTHKTLTEIEPRIAVNATNTPGDADSLFKIAQPGSYYLTGNITGVSLKRGIEIAAGGVTLDLNGFELVGVAGSLGGVRTSVNGLTNIEVRNGIIRAWGGIGIDLVSNPATGCIVTRIRAHGNDVSGIAVAEGSAVINCVASGNASQGILTNSGCTVSHCVAYANSNDGIVANGSGTVNACTAYGNNGSGIFTYSATTVTGCSAHSNSGDGISVGVGSTVADCTARANADGGLNTGNDCTISGCNVVDNFTSGIQTGSRCAILKTTVSGTFGGPGVLASIEGLRIEASTINFNGTFGVVVNTVSDIAELAVIHCTIRGNGSAGISSEASTQVLDSLVSSNGSAGIRLTSSSHVRGCTITSNAGSGVELLANANVVAENLFSTNAPTLATDAGILVQGTDNTIEANRLFSNVQGGIKINSAGNLVLRNYLARLGATITAVGGNAVAQIISPGAGFVSTDPNANLTY